jgi:hypothetical protein
MKHNDANVSVTIFEVKKQVTTKVEPTRTVFP